MAINNSFTFFAVCFVKNLPLTMLSNYFLDLVNQLQSSLHTSEELVCLSQWVKVSNCRCNSKGTEFLI